MDIIRSNEINGLMNDVWVTDGTFEDEVKADFDYMSRRMWFLERKIDNLERKLYKDQRIKYELYHILKEIKQDIKTLKDSKHTRLRL